MGQFRAGTSGNPGGRPKGITEVRDLARKHTKAAIDKLALIMKKSESDRAAIMAATALLDRGWGKPAQPISGDDELPPVKIDARAILSDTIARVVAASAKRRGNQEAE